MGQINLGTVIPTANDKRGQDGLKITPIGHCSICTSCADLLPTL